MPTTTLSAVLATTLAVAPVYGPEPAPTPEDSALVDARRDLDTQARRYEHMGQVGLGLAGLGAVVMLTVTVPSYVLYKRAMDNAADDEFVVTRDETLRRARLRRNFMHGSLAVGAGLAVTGLVVAIAGYRHRTVIQRQRAALTWSPAIGPGHLGAAATVRF